MAGDPRDVRARLSPTAALVALLALIGIGAGAIVGLEIIHRDPGQVIFYLAPIVGVLVPVLLAAIRGEQVVSEIRAARADVADITNGGLRQAVGEALTEHAEQTSDRDPTGRPYGTYDGRKGQG